MSRKDKSLSTLCFTIFVKTALIGLGLILLTGILKIFITFDGFDNIVRLGFFFIGVAGVALVGNFVFLMFEKEIEDSDPNVLDDQKETRAKRLRKKFNEDDRKI